jgi:hypothetical protein
MEPNDWVRNKQTVEVGFYEVDQANYTDEFILKLYFKAWNRKSRLPTFIFFRIFSTILRRLWKRHLTPFGHVNFTVHDMTFETYIGFCAVKIPMNSYPSYDELIELTGKYRPQGSGPLIAAYLIMLLFFPLFKMGYPKPSGDCVSHTVEILNIFGIKQLEKAWCPSSLFKELTEEKECQITWMSSKNLL